MGRKARARQLKTEKAHRVMKDVRVGPLQLALVDLVVEWADEHDRQSLLSGRVTDPVDLRPWVVKKILEDPIIRGEQLMTRVIASGAVPEDLVCFLNQTFPWIDRGAASVEEADATITRFCSGLPIEWSRNADGFRIRPAGPNVMETRVGGRLRDAASETTIRKVVAHHLRRCAMGGATCMRVWSNGHELEIVAETRFVNPERTERVTCCGLRSEWRELTGEDVVWREEPERPS
jgi:hypothetical protein